MKTTSRRPAKTRGFNRGLTLIEVLIGVGISALIIIALLAIYMAGQRYFFNQSAKADAIEEIRAPLARIARDIREAAQVSQSTVSVGGDDYATAEADCLVLDVPSLDVTGIIIPGLEDTIIYAVNAGRLHRIVVANGPGRTNEDDLLAEGVTAFNLAFFTEDGITPVTGSAYSEAFIVNVTLTASRPAVQRQGQPYVETLHTRVKLRNRTLPLPG
jgi:Tfp pilus assembly protein PilW